MISCWPLGIARFEVGVLTIREKSSCVLERATGDRHELKETTYMNAREGKRRERGEVLLFLRDVWFWIYVCK